MPRLILTNPEFNSQSCELPDGTWSVGRTRQSHLVIQDDSVSADHCELLVHGSEVIVREHGSRNGTFVDGVRVKAQSGVCHGQRLRFGRVEGIIEIDPPTDEDATGFTAHDDYRRIMHRGPSPATHATPFPIIFAPGGTGDASSPTQMVAALPTPPLPAPASTCNATSQTGSTQASRRWMWVAASILVVTMLILWLRMK